MSPINTAYKGDFLSLDDQPRRVAHAGDRRHLPRPAGARRRRPAAARARDRLSTGGADGPDPTLSWESLARPLRRARTASPRASRAPGPTTPGSCSPRAPPAARRASSSRTPPTTSRRAAFVESLAVGRGCSLEDLPARPSSRCLPLFHSNAQVLCAYPAMLVGRARGLRRALLGHPLLAAVRSTPRRRSSTRIGAIPYFLWNTAAVAARPGPQGAHDLRRARRRRTSTTSSRSASASA